LRGLESNGMSQASSRARNGEVEAYTEGLESVVSFTGVRGRVPAENKFSAF